MHKPLNILPETGGDSVACKTFYVYGISAKHSEFYTWYPVAGTDSNIAA